MRHAAPGTGPGPDDGAVSGLIGPSEFCLSFMPLRSPFDVTAGRQGGESDLDPQINVENIDRAIPLMVTLIGVNTALVGRFEETGSGCVVRSSVRPRIALVAPIAYVMAMVCLCGLSFWNGMNWIGFLLALAVVLVPAYWIAAVLSGSIRSGVGILRFMDRVWKDCLVQ